MKQTLFAMCLALACLLTASLLTACEDTDIGLATRAGMEAVKAATLDDAEVARLSQQASHQADQQHTVAPSDHPQTRRLQRLAAQLPSTIDGRRFTFKVYLSPTVNAFAMADGTIRVYSGLMDMLDDKELLFVLGHEMGHVVEGHVTEKLRLAYAGSALRKAIGSQQNEAGAIARSVLGAFAESLLNAQFSQHEEREADDFGLKLLQEQGHSPQAAVSALRKLATLGSSHTFLSSHPAPEARARRLEEQAVASQE